MDALDLNWETHSGPIELLVALAIGLMVGLEREWRVRHDQAAPDDHAGLRTFGLIGLLGGIAGLLQPNAGGWVIAGVLLAIAALMIARRRKGDAGMPLEDVTTTVAALVVAMLGALATHGMPQLAAA